MKRYTDRLSTHIQKNKKKKKKKKKQLINSSYLTAFRTFELDSVIQYSESVELDYFSAIIGEGGVSLVGHLQRAQLDFSIGRV